MSGSYTDGELGGECGGIASRVGTSSAWELVPQLPSKRDRAALEQGSDTARGWLGRDVGTAMG